MPIRDQIRKHSNWTNTAVTAGAVTLVAATGMALADDGGDRAQLRDRIQLQDRAPITQSVEASADQNVISGPVLFASPESSYDSPLDDPAAAATEPSAPIANDSPSDSSASVAADSYDSPAAPAPQYSASFDSEASFDSGESFDSPD